MHLTTTTISCTKISIQLATIVINRYFFTTMYLYLMVTITSSLILVINRSRVQNCMHTCIQTPHINIGDNTGGTLYYHIYTFSYSLLVAYFPFTIHILILEFALFAMERIVSFAWNGAVVGKTCKSLESLIFIQWKTISQRKMQALQKQIFHYLNTYIHT